MPYALDTTGSLAANLITNEQHALNESAYGGFRYLIPFAGPFYRVGLVVQITINGVTTTLTKDVDYYLRANFMGATRSIGQDIFGIIEFNSIYTTGIVTLRYQTLGGIWVGDRNAILIGVVQRQLNPRLVSWDDISNVQQVFPTINYSPQLNVAGTVQGVTSQITLIASDILSSPPTTVVQGLLIGPQGPSYIAMVGAPAINLGANGDRFVDIGTGNAYLKANSVWGSDGVLTGPTGATGISYDTASAATLANTNDNNAAVMATSLRGYSQSLNAAMVSALAVAPSTISGFNGNVVANCYYNTLNDFKRGAWRFRCSGKSWYNEVTTATGKWLGYWISEAYARAMGNSAFGTERVINGSFNSDVSSWAGTGITTWSAGMLSLVSSVGYQNSAQTITGLTAGKVYRVSVDFGTTSVGQSYFDVGVGASGLGSGVRTASAIFTATGTTQVITLINTGIATTYFDNVSVKEVTSQLATTGDYYYDTTQKKFYSLNATTGVTEVFRGSTKQFPQRTYITVEAGRVAIWDLKDGSMWMVFVSAGFPTSLLFSTFIGSSVAAINGQLLIGSQGANGQLSIVNFVSDIEFTLNGTANKYNKYSVSLRNITAGSVLLETGTAPVIVSRNVNSVAITVLPTAPFDPATGMPIPTIAVGTAGGVSVIKDDGTVVNSATPYAVVNEMFIDANYRLYFGRNQYNWVYVADLTNLSAGFSTVVSNAQGGSNTNAWASVSGKITKTGNSSIAVAGTSSGGVSKLSLIKSTLGADVTNVYPTGNMIGDIILATLADTVVETVSGTELVTNGGFDTDINWIKSTGTVITSGIAKLDGVTVTGNGTVLLGSAANLALTAGKTYKCTFTVINGGGEGYSLNICGIAGNIVVGPGTYTQYITATTTIAPVQIMQRSNNGARSASFDNISVSECSTDRSVKANPYTVQGSLSKVAANPSTQLVAYSGFSDLGDFYAPLQSSLLLTKGVGSATFTRATTATVVDFEGNIKYCKSGEARFAGARRGENLLSPSGLDTGIVGIASSGFTTSTLAGFPGAIACAASATSKYGYITNYTPATGRRYIISVYIQMLDLSAPQGGVVTADATKDVLAVVGGSVATVYLGATPVGNGIYRLAWLSTTVIANNVNCGVVQYAGNSGKGFIASGYMLEDVTGQSTILVGDYIPSTENTTGVTGVRYYTTMPDGKTPISSSTSKFAYGCVNTGDYFSTPSAAANQVTGNLTLAAWIAPTTWVPTTVQTVISKDNTLVTGRSYSLSIQPTTGLLRLSFSLDGTNILSYNSTVATGYMAGTKHAIAVERDATTGNIRFYTSEDKVTWTQLGTTVAGTVGAIYASNAPVVIGNLTGSALLFDGRLYDAEISTGFACSTTTGVLVLDCDPSNWSIGTTWTSADTSTVWTINGNAKIYKGWWDANGPRGYLAESAGTNQVLYQNKLDGTNWVVANSLTVAINSAMAPDGTNTANVINATAGTVGYVGCAGARSVNSTASIFAKASTGCTSIWLSGLFSASNEVQFNLLTGVVQTTNGTGVVGTIEAFPDGWYKCSILLPLSDTLLMVVSPKSVLTANAGAVTTGACSVLLWGAQCEVNPFSTSLMPTAGATFTRNADLLSYPSAGNVKILDPYTVYSEFQLNGLVSTGWQVAVGSNLNFAAGLAIYNPGASGNVYLFSNSTGNGSPVALGDTNKLTSVHKLAGRMDGFNSTAVVDGIVGTPLVKGTQTAEIGQIQVGTWVGGSYLNGTVRNVRFTQTALSNSLLQSLTGSGVFALNNLYQPYSSNLDFGTGTFSIFGWVNLSALAPGEYIFNRDSLTPGQAIRIYFNASGSLVFELYDGTTTRTATATFSITASWVFVVVTYSAGTLNIYLNALLSGTATGTALLTLSNTAAVSTIGSTVLGTRGLSHGQLSLFRISATVPSQDQISYMCETERHMLEPGAKCTIQGTTTAVLAMDYSEATGMLVVGTAGTITEFDNLTVANTYSVPAAIGTLTDIKAQDGYTILSGTTGTYVYKPALNLSEQKFKSKNSLYTLGEIPEPVPALFTATASQTDFVLQPGQQPTENIFVAGAFKQLGATKDYIILDDGFRKTIRFAVGIAVNTKVTVQYIQER